MLTTLLLMGDPNQGGGATSLIFMGLIFVVFYFFIIRPQSQKQKEIQNKISAMKKGDKVVTNGGIVGTVNTIDADSVLVEVDGNVKIRFIKNAIVDVNPPKAAANGK